MPTGRGGKAAVSQGSAAHFEAVVTTETTARFEDKGMTRAKSCLFLCQGTMRRLRTANDQPGLPAASGSISQPSDRELTSASALWLMSCQDKPAMFLRSSTTNCQSWAPLRGRQPFILPRTKPKAFVFALA